MLFGVPALVVDLPNNLSPFVDRGVMVGARTAADIGAALRAILEDETARAQLKQRQAAFLAEFVPEADGGSCGPGGGGHSGAGGRGTGFAEVEGRIRAGCESPITLAAWSQFRRFGLGPRSRGFSPRGVRPVPVQ